MSYLLYERSCELLFTHVRAETIKNWLLPLGIADWQGTYHRLLRMADATVDRRAFAHLLPYLLMILTEVADAEHVLVNLERFITNTQDPATILRTCAANPRTLEILIKLFAGSQFLTEILLRTPDYFTPLMAYAHLAQPKTTADLNAEIVQHLAEHDVSMVITRPISHAPDTVGQQLDMLRRFQRRELLRIGVCDLLDLCDLPTTTAQLSHLADSLTQVCLHIAAAQTGQSVDNFVVLAMGKLGGEELNYSSDIDLLFIAREHAERYTRLAERLITALTQVTGEGFLYRVDMRLRPWGQVGALVSSLSGYMKYLNKHARHWEKQALLKARPIAGDIRLGEEFLAQCAPVLFARGPAEAHTIRAHAIRVAIHEMKQRTEAHWLQKGKRWGDVKLGAGSIRDVEFVTQYLQLIHGEQHPYIRRNNTLDALTRLSAQQLLPPADGQTLRNGYIFLRTIEHHLQMCHYHQTHTLPAQADARTHLAQRLGFQGDDAGSHFVLRYEQHRVAIRAVYTHYVGSDQMTSSSPPISPKSNPVATHIARMTTSYTETFTAMEVEQHSRLAASLNHDNLVEIVAVPLENAGWRITVVAYDYLGELSLICGLISVYGGTIADGNVFTYQPAPAPQQRGCRARGRRHRGPRLSTASLPDTRRKIVDVFTVYPARNALTTETWHHYSQELAQLLTLMHADQRREARGTLAKRWANTLRGLTPTVPALYPIHIEIDNDTSDEYTMLQISALDTPGFLYEFTTALAYHRIYIAGMTVDSIGEQVHDVLYVTDASGHKITVPEKQHQLRVAAVLIKHFSHLLPQSPNPESALLHFRQFISQLFQQDAWTDEIASLERPEVLSALARLLGVSDFLWEDFLRMQHANLFPVVTDMDALGTMKNRTQLQAELEAQLRPVHDGPQPIAAVTPWRKTLNAFKDREMFRIDMRHILGHTQEFWDFSEELTALAEVIVNSAYHLCHEDLRAEYGTPLLDNGDVSEMTVCALGKCGGRELGFASDIELMFIYAGNGHTSGPHGISTTAFYEKLVQNFVSAIKTKREGIFEIDLQLRPYGKAGSMGVALEAFRRYYVPDGPAWGYERQALVKLRPIAGNVGLGAHVTALRDACVYTGTPFDATAMRAMRERQVRHLVTGGTFNAKFSPGALVDVEYLVQGLQITHGAQHPELRHTNIRAAMVALADAGILNADDYAQLRRAHTFLCWLVDGLRMVQGNSKDLTVPPYNTEAFAFLARRLRYGDDVARLQAELHNYAQRVLALGQKLL